MIQYFGELFGDLSAYDPDLVFVVASCFGLLALVTLLRIFGSVIFSIFNVK